MEHNKALILYTVKDKISFSPVKYPTLGLGKAEFFYSALMKLMTNYQNYGIE